MKKDIRDIAIATMAIGTAWGIGVLSCLYFELKLVASCYAETKREKESRIEE